MKTYTEFVQLINNAQDAIGEDLRSSAGIALTFRVRQFNTKIKQIVIHQTDSELIQFQKLAQKIDLLSDQLIAATYVTSQLGIMK